MHELIGLVIGYGSMVFTGVILYLAVFRDALRAMRLAPVTTRSGS